MTIKIASSLPIDSQTPNDNTNDFAKRVLTWFYAHGRHDLPWQNLSGQFDPYPVWISEIMLQQTQVATVIGYYTRFMQRFKTLSCLAQAPLDEVISHWAGLGYYARARNLHKTAKQLKHIIDATGDYPQSLEQWQALAGIGQSTAGAIMAMGLGKFGVICDGNVKRVLARHFAIKDDLNKSATNKHLWQIAQKLTPTAHSGHYAQAMMDIGATLCTRTRPNCTACPINTTCQAYQNGAPTDYPVKTKKATKPTHHATALLIKHQGKSLWVKRPPIGIWGAMWCLPMDNHSKDNTQDEQVLCHLLKPSVSNCTPLAQIRHTLTHFHWQIDLVVLKIDAGTKTAIDHTLTSHNTAFAWYAPSDINQLGIPVAIHKLINIAWANFDTQSDVKMTTKSPK